MYKMSTAISFQKFEEIVVIQFIKFVIKVVQIYVTLLLTDAIKRWKSVLNESEQYLFLWNHSPCALASSAVNAHNSRYRQNWLIISMEWRVPESNVLYTLQHAPDFVHKKAKVHVCPLPQYLNTSESTVCSNTCSKQHLGQVRICLC